MVNDMGPVRGVKGNGCLQPVNPFHTAIHSFSMPIAANVLVCIFQVGTLCLLIAYMWSIVTVQSQRRKFSGRILSIHGINYPVVPRFIGILEIEDALSGVLITDVDPFLRIELHRGITPGINSITALDHVRDPITLDIGKYLQHP